MAHGSRSSADSARKQRVQEAFLLNYTKFEKKTGICKKHLGGNCALSGEKSKKMATCLGHLSGYQFRGLFMVEAACSARIQFIRSRCVKSREP